jgi:hypothetical protein
MLAVLTMAVTTPSARALPSDPNNAALLYYQAFLMMPQGQDQARTLLNDLPYGVEPNEQVREYLKQCQPAIELAVAAAQIPACDWGLRYSKYFEMQMPCLAQMRRLTFAVGDDAKILVADGQYRLALERCLATRRMAAHTGDTTVISFIVHVAINALADKAIQNTLSAMPPDEQVLSWLKGELTTAPGKPLLLQNALNTEEEMKLAQLDMDHKDWVLQAAQDSVDDVPAAWLDRVKNADAAFFEGTRKYYQNHMNAVRAVLDSSAPYSQKLSRLEALDKQPGVDARENPHATLTAVFVTSFSRVLTVATRATADDNALKTAIEIYLVKATTGSLPSQLPPGMPKDPFSSQDFKYEKTKEGFRITRWTDDPTKDKTWQFEYKVR